MNTKRFLCAALGAICSLAFMQAQVRTEQTFEKGWKFTREDNADFAKPGFNDAKWQNVTVPHDWAIYGPFSINNDKQEMAITQDGQTEAMEHAGRTGGLPFVGTGWYRLNFDAPSFEKGKKATLIFDGAMSHARVYINGQEAGYSSVIHITLITYLIKNNRFLINILHRSRPSKTFYRCLVLYTGMSVFRFPIFIILSCISMNGA